jgi:hypothetical protein
MTPVTAVASAAAPVTTRTGIGTRFSSGDTRGRIVTTCAAERVRMEILV